MVVVHAQAASMGKEVTLWQPGCSFACAGTVRQRGDARKDRTCEMAHVCIGGSETVPAAALEEQSTPRLSDVWRSPAELCFL